MPFNNWLEPHVGDGRLAYLNWTNTPLDANDSLWLEDNFNNMVKKHYSDLATRRNVFTGKLYRDDDTCARLGQRGRCDGLERLSNPCSYSPVTCLIGGEELCCARPRPLSDTQSGRAC